MLGEPFALSIDYACKQFLTWRTERPIYYSYWRSRAVRSSREFSRSSIQLRAFLVRRGISLGRGFLFHRETVARSTPIASASCELLKPFRFANATSSSTSSGVHAFAMGPNLLPRNISFALCNIYIPVYDIRYNKGNLMFYYCCMRSKPAVYLYRKQFLFTFKNGGFMSTSARLRAIIIAILEAQGQSTPTGAQLTLSLESESDLVLEMWYRGQEDIGIVSVHALDFAGEKRLVFETYKNNSTVAVHYTGRWEQLLEDIYSDLRIESRRELV